MSVLRYLKNKSFTNLTVYGFGQGFNLVTPLLVAPYIIRVCGEESYGKINICLSVFFFLMVLVDYGSDISGVKDVSVSRNDTNVLCRMLSTAYVSRVIMLAAVLFVIAILLFVIPYFKDYRVLYLLAMPVLAGQALSPLWVFQGLENFKWSTFTNILSKLIYLGGIFFSIKQEEDYIYANLWWGIGMVFANCIALVFLNRKYGLSIMHTSFAEIKEFLKKNFGILGSQVFFSLQMYSPLFIIGFFGGDALAGKYKIVEQVIVIFRTYILLFFNYVYPRVCYLIEQSREACLRFWKLYNGANFLFILALMVVVFLNADFIIRYFNPGDSGELAVTLRIATGIPVAFAISTPLKQLLLADGFQKNYIRITFVMVLFSVVLITALLYVYRLNGVIVSLIISELITAVLFRYAANPGQKHI